MALKSKFRCMPGEWTNGPLLYVRHIRSSSIIQCKLTIGCLVIIATYLSIDTYEGREAVCGAECASVISM